MELDESLLNALNVKIKEVAETHLSNLKCVYEVMYSSEVIQDDTYNNDKTPIGFQKWKEPDKREKQKMSKIELMQGDCLEKMKDIPDGSVDMILCDLPYGDNCLQVGHGDSVWAAVGAVSAYCEAERGNRADSESAFYYNTDCKQYEDV